MAQLEGCNFCWSWMFFLMFTYIYRQTWMRPWHSLTLEIPEQLSKVFMVVMVAIGIAHDPLIHSPTYDSRTQLSESRLRKCLQIFAVYLDWLPGRSTPVGRIVPMFDTTIFWLAAHSARPQRCWTLRFPRDSSSGSAWPGVLDGDGDQQMVQ